MTRLPQPGADGGTWGDILNDYLLQAHNADGTLKPASVTEETLDSAVRAKLDTPGPQGPKGDKGDKGDTGNDSTVPGPANVLHIGTVTTLDPGNQAAATITGTTPDQTVNFDIPKGNPGDTTPATVTTWNGSVALTPTSPTTITATLTGNVTLTLATPAASTSFTVTVIALQDATGSRTLTATNVTWPYGVAPVLTTTANSLDLIHFLWTGTRLLGLPGGLAFA